MDHFRSVKIKDRLGFVVIRFEPISNDREFRVIKTVLAQRAALQTFNQFVQVAASKIKNSTDVERVLQHLRLADISRDAIQNERVLLRIKVPQGLASLDRLLPELDCGFVRHEFATAGVLEESAAQFIVDAQVAKDIATRAVVEVRDRSEDFPLCAFARSR